jgi:hypothetical protein
MIRSAHAAAHMLLEIENIDEENFIEFNEVMCFSLVSYFTLCRNSNNCRWLPFGSS